MSRVSVIRVARIGSRTPCDHAREIRHQPARLSGRAGGAGRKRYRMESARP
jgi:hypothetical protein